MTNDALVLQCINLVRELLDSRLPSTVTSYCILGPIVCLWQGRHTCGRRKTLRSQGSVFQRRRTWWWCPGQQWCQRQHWRLWCRPGCLCCPLAVLTEPRTPGTCQALDTDSSAMLLLSLQLLVNMHINSASGNVLLRLCREQISSYWLIRNVIILYSSSYMDQNLCFKNIVQLKQWIKN